MPETQPEPRRRTGTAVPLLLACAMALLTIVMMIWLKIASPTAPPFPNNSSNGEKIANAIATPPAPVPEWLSFLYPWQTLLSADLALIAALLGAWAIMAQVRGSLDAVHTQIRAAREDEQTRLTHEREAQAEQAREQQRRIAGAIAAELASWMNRFGQYQLLQRYRIAIQQRGPVEIPPIYAVNRFSVFDSVSDMLGEFEPPLPEYVVSSYGAVRGVLDILRDLRATQPLPAFDTAKASPDEKRQRRELEQDREAYFNVALQNLVVELGYLDNMGRHSIEGLARISGLRAPDVPLWQ